MSEYDRRRLMKEVGKLSGIGALTIGSSGTAIGAPSKSNRGQTDLDIDVTFSPNDKKKVIQFLQSLDGLTEKERVEAQELLNKPQAEAVTDVLKNVNIKSDRIGEEANTENSVSIQYNVEQNVSDTARVWAEHWCTGHGLWELELTVEWDYMIGNLMDVRKKPKARVHDSTWSHQGEVTSWMHDEEDGNELEWEVYQEHRFEYLGAGAVPSVSYNPYIHMRGEDNYPAEIVDKRDNISGGCPIIII